MEHLLPFFCSYSGVLPTKITYGNLFIFVFVSWSPIAVGHSVLPTIIMTYVNLFISAFLEFHSGW